MKQFLQLGLWSALNLVLTFLFQVYVLTHLGAGAETDALFAAMAVPQLILAVTSAPLMQVLVPALSGESEARVRRDAWAVFWWVVAIFSAGTALLYLSTPRWVPWVVPGFSDDARGIAIELAQIQLLGIVFSGVNSVQMAYCHVKGTFLWVEFAAFLTGAAAMLGLVWALPIYGIHAAAWILTGRAALQAVLLAPVMGRPAGLNGGAGVLGCYWSRLKPLMLGNAYYKTEPLLDRVMLSMANSGSLSLYYLGQQIYGSGNQILYKSVVGPLVPALSHSYKRHAIGEFRQLYYRALWKVGVVSCTAFLVVVSFGHSALEILIGFGNLDAEHIDLLWWTMIFLGGILVAGATGQVSSSAFYAVGDSKTPTRIGVYSYTVYMPLKIASFYWFGMEGLAVMSSLFFSVNFVLQHYLINEKLAGGVGG